MRTKLSPEETMTGFELLDLHRLDAHTFLQSDIHEEISELTGLSIERIKELQKTIDQE